MRKGFQLAAAPARSSRPNPLRIFLDANVWVSYLASAVAGRDSAAARLGRIAVGVDPAPCPIQLVVSVELLETLARVLRERGHSDDAVNEFLASLKDVCATGPDPSGQILVLGGKGQLAMSDEEDAGILEACFAGGVELLVTDNLRHFETKDSERIDTQVARYAHAAERQLFALHHRRPDGGEVLVMHPFDALDLFEDGRRPDRAAVVDRFGAKRSGI